METLNYFAIKIVYDDGSSVMEFGSFDETLLKERMIKDRESDIPVKIASIIAYTGRRYSLPYADKKWEYKSDSLFYKAAELFEKRNH